MTFGVMSDNVGVIISHLSFKSKKTQLEKKKKEVKPSFIITKLFPKV